MASKDTAVFESRVYTLVAAIPNGCVATYGQLAFLAGRPLAARLAGRALRFAPPGLACHRVVNSAGQLVVGWAQQRSLLAAEGITFRPNGNVDVKRHRWDHEVSV